MRIFIYIHVRVSLILTPNSSCVGGFVAWKFHRIVGPLAPPSITSGSDGFIERSQDIVRATPPANTQTPRITTTAFAQSSRCFRRHRHAKWPNFWPSARLPKKLSFDGNGSCCYLLTACSAWHTAREGARFRKGRSFFNELRVDSIGYFPDRITVRETCACFASRALHHLALAAKRQAWRNSLRTNNFSRWCSGCPPCIAHL